MKHPSSIVLEAFACGEHSPDVAAHIDACDACRAFVARAKAFSASPSPDPAQVARVVAQAHGRARRRVALTLATTVGPLLAVAAAVVIYARSAPPVVSSADAPTASASASVASVAMVETREPPATTFKGTVQIAVVRDRAGAQTRQTAVVGVRPGDRLRIEVAIDREQTILGAVLGDDGSYLELMPAGSRVAGTHFSERSVSIDATPAHGRVLVGSPDAVARARQTRRFDEVASVRLAWEDAP